MLNILKSALKFSLLTVTLVTASSWGLFTVTQWGWQMADGEQHFAGLDADTPVEALGGIYREISNQKSGVRIQRPNIVEQAQTDLSPNNDLGRQALALLRSQTAKEQHAGLLRFLESRSQDPRAVEVVQSLLPKFPSLSAQALGQIGHAAESALPDLVKNLDHQDLLNPQAKDRQNPYNPQALQRIQNTIIAIRKIETRPWQIVTFALVRTRSEILSQTRSRLVDFPDSRRVLDEIKKSLKGRHKRLTSQLDSPGKSKIR